MEENVRYEQLQKALQGIYFAVDRETGKKSTRQSLNINCKSDTHIIMFAHYRFSFFIGTLCMKVSFVYNQDKTVIY